MRIILTVDPEIPVPPVNYGGIERIVDALIGSYSSKGHEVYLIAHPDSTNNGVQGKFGWPALKSRGIKNVLSNTLFLKKTTNQLKPDIIHSFSRLLYLYPVFMGTGIPIIQTYQRAISHKSTQLASFIAGKRLTYTCCGSHMLKDHAIAASCTPVYNFTDVGYFVPDNNTEKKHLMYLGRIEEIKGTKEAIEVAIATDQKLIIAGNIQPGHEEYFEANVKTYQDHPLIDYVGPLDDQRKRTYLQGAKALLFPVKWEEPFGIVMAESMACGTPVIGFNKGSVPEVVRDGVTGYVVDTKDQMINAVNKIDLIDRNKVRHDCEDRFSLEVISQNYLDLFTSMLHQ